MNLSITGQSSTISKLRSFEVTRDFTSTFFQMSSGSAPKRANSQPPGNKDFPKHPSTLIPSRHPVRLAAAGDLLPRSPKNRCSSSFNSSSEPSSAAQQQSRRRRREKEGKPGTHQLSASYRESRPLVVVVVVSKSRTLEARRSPKTEVVNYFSLAPVCGADPAYGRFCTRPSGVGALLSPFLMHIPDTADSLRVRTSQDDGYNCESRRVSVERFRDGRTRNGQRLRRRRLESRFIDSANG